MRDSSIAMIPAITIDTRKTIRPPVPAITGSEDEPEITWPDLLEARLIDSTGHEVIFDPTDATSPPATTGGGPNTPNGQARRHDDPRAYSDG